MHPTITKFIKALSPRQWRLLGTGAQALAAGIAIGVVMYAGVVIASSYMKTHDFEEAVKKEARLAASDSRPIENIREDLMAKSQDLGLPISRENIAVVSGRKQADIPIEGMTALVQNQTTSELPTVGTVNIDVSYSVPIAFPLYTVQLKFHVHGDDHSI